MKWWLRLGSGFLGVLFIATAFLTFFHFVPSSWHPPTGEPVVVSETVRARTDDGWSDDERFRTMALSSSGDGYVATVELAGLTGPAERSLRVPVEPDLNVRAAGAGAGALWTFPVRDPFTDRPDTTSIAVVRMDAGLPLVVAVDTFDYVGPATVEGLDVEHWVAHHASHRFVDDGRRYERVAERHAYVEPVSGVVVAWQEHEQLWTHWGDRFRSGGDVVDVLLEGPISGRDYLPIWDAWTNTTQETEAKLVDLAKDVRTQRFLGMVGWASPALLAGEMGLWLTIAPPGRWPRRD